jgi:hypothetical protein
MDNFDQTEGLDQDGVTVATSPIELPIEDEELVSRIESRIRESARYFDSVLELPQRRKRLEDYYLGKQLDEEVIDGDIPHVDNILRRNLEFQITLASGRMPDIIVGPANDSSESQKRAKKFEKFLNLKIASDATRRLAKDALRRHKLHFVAIVKCIWDPNKGENGDFRFELIRPEKIVFDHTAIIPHDGFTADNIDFIAEEIEEPLSIVLAKFPDKKENILELSGYNQNKKSLASKIKYKEVHFTWYSDSGKQYEGVAWIYNRTVLKKQKAPYYDWTGYEKVAQNELGEYIVQNYYRNHFERPRKPYIFLTVANLGRGPVDETTDFEQAISNQQILNRRNRQITEIADYAIPRNVFSGEYITKEAAAAITPDRRESIWLEGAKKASDAMMTIQATPVDQTLLQDVARHERSIDSTFATNSTTRGEAVPQESGISKQISREGNLTIADDTSQLVVQRLVYEMANWATQMMKLFYKETHFIRSMGEDGEVIYLDLKQDEIDDGISVNVKANSVDKHQRRADALNLASAKAIDPLTLAEDLDLPDPKTRVTRLLAWLKGSIDGYASYAKLIGADTNMPETEPDAKKDIESLTQGEAVQPQNIDENYLSEFLNFVQSPEFEALPEDAKERVQQYIQSLKQTAESLTSQPQTATLV